VRVTPRVVLTPLEHVRTRESHRCGWRSGWLVRVVCGGVNTTRCWVVPRWSVCVCVRVCMFCSPVFNRAQSIARRMRLDAADHSARWPQWPALVKLRALRALQPHHVRQAPSSYVTAKMCIGNTAHVKSHSAIVEKGPHLNGYLLKSFFCVAITRCSVKPPHERRGRSVSPCTLCLLPPTNRF
jgi:hypothetical protein